MRRKRTFLHSSLDLLERRVVLTRTALGTPVIVSGLYLSKLDLPAAGLNSRPKPRTVSTQFD